jgi:O-antigen ligase
MVAVIIYWLVTRPAIPARDRLHWRFLAFVLVMLASWFLSPYQSVGDVVVEDYLKYFIFYVLLVTSVQTEKDLGRIVTGYLAAMSLFMLHSMYEYFHGRAVWAQGLLRLFPVGISYDFNDFAGLIICSLPLAWVAWRRSRGWKQTALVGGYFSLAAFCIVLTGSRMGFAGLILASVLACLASPKRWRLLTILPVALALAWLSFSEVQKDRYKTLFDPDPRSTYGAAAIGDYRFGGLERGLSMLQERPLLGFGPSSFCVVGYHKMMAHNLYGQLLGELGIAGALAFAAMSIGIVQNVLEARRIVRGMSAVDDQLAWHVVAAVAAAVLLLLIMGWGFNFLYWYVWLWFGGFQAVALRCLKRRAESGQMDDFMPLEPQDEELADPC